jgi:aryl-alcohol dehydrogenase-like predicted oxidoreductase
MGSFKQKSLERTRSLVEALKEIAANHDASPAQVALAWVIRRHGESVVAIPGASSVTQVESNAASMKLELAETEMAQLAEVAEKVAA